MNLIEFTKILSDPLHVEAEQVSGLESIVQEYPYFQVARFLHLNGLKNKRSFRYNDALKKTAAFTTDRSVLFDYITAFDFDIHPAPANLLGSKPAEEKSVETPGAAAHPVAEESLEEDTSAGTEAGPEEVLGIGKPLQFKSDEIYSFREWLQLSEIRPIERSEIPDRKKEEAETRSNQGTNMDLIDRFIAASPKIGPTLTRSFDDIATESVTENENLMTETLAHVYVEQKKYEKAITAFTILSLKYPEKSSFFANQIEAIKNLQNK